MGDDEENPTDHAGVDRPRSETEVNMTTAARRVHPSPLSVAGSAEGRTS
jgi:hypothetical protein